MQACCLGDSFASCLPRSVNLLAESASVRLKVSAKDNLQSGIRQNILKHA